MTTSISISSAAHSIVFTDRHMHVLIRSISYKQGGSGAWHIDKKMWSDSISTVFVVVVMMMMLVVVVMVSMKVVLMMIMVMQVAVIVVLLRMTVEVLVIMIMLVVM